MPEFTFLDLSNPTPNPNHAPYGRCRCGAVLPRQPTRTTPIKEPTLSRAGNIYNKTVGYSDLRVCKKCGTYNVTNERIT